MELSTTKDKNGRESTSKRDIIQKKRERDVLLCFSFFPFDKNMYFSFNLLTFLVCFFISFPPFFARSFSYLSSFARSFILFHFETLILHLFFSFFFFYLFSLFFLLIVLLLRRLLVFSLFFILFHFLFTPSIICFFVFFYFHYFRTNFHVCRKYLVILNHHISMSDVNSFLKCHNSTD